MVGVAALGRRMLECGRGRKVHPARLFRRPGRAFIFCKHNSRSFLCPHRNRPVNRIGLGWMTYAFAQSHQALNFPLAHIGLAELPWATTLFIEASLAAAGLQPRWSKSGAPKQVSHTALPVFPDPACRMPVGFCDGSWPEHAIPGPQGDPMASGKAFAALGLALILCVFLAACGWLQARGTRCASDI